MWRALRGDQLGVAFRRQHPVGPYVLDFYCPSLKLAIELDGNEHAYRIARDRRRDRYLCELGIAVLRFSNLEVTRNLAGVWEVISAEVRRRGKCPPPELARANSTSPF